MDCDPLRWRLILKRENSPQIIPRVDLVEDKCNTERESFNNWWWVEFLFLGLCDTKGSEISLYFQYVFLRHTVWPGENISDKHISLERFTFQETFLMLGRFDLIHERQTERCLEETIFD